MPQTLNKLSDADCRNAAPRSKPYRLFDGLGLYLEVAPSGSRYWRLKYRFAGREKRVALGMYPEIKLKEARELALRARRQRESGLDPSAEKRRAIRTTEALAANTFEQVALEWHAANASGWTPGHAATTVGRLKRDVFPWLGRRPITEIDAPELLQTLRRIEDRGAVETAHRIRQICDAVFAYAIATRRAPRNPASEIKGALRPVKVRHLPAVTEPRAVAQLLRAIDGYAGTFVVRCAFKLAPLLFVRPGELRQAEWTEFDLDAAEWRIPAERMKRRIPHIVPLSQQAVAILRELRAYSGQGRYVFPGGRSPRRPMSNNALTAALRRMGYDRETMTWHGFRSIATTLLNEQGWGRDAIERQLAHTESNKVRAAYHRAEHLRERRLMMQGWADYLDQLRQNLLNG